MQKIPTTLMIMFMTLLFQESVSAQYDQAAISALKKGDVFIHKVEYSTIKRTGSRLYISTSSNSFSPNIPNYLDEKKGNSSQKKIAWSKNPSLLKIRNAIIIIIKSVAIKNRA